MDAKKLNSVLTFFMYRPKEELHFMGIAESGATAFSKPREFMADIHRDNLREAGVEFANDSGLREIQVGDYVATQYHARECIPKGDSRSLSAWFITHGDYGYQLIFRSNTLDPVELDERAEKVLAVFRF